MRVITGPPEEFFRLCATREERANVPTLVEVPRGQPHYRPVFGATRGGLACVTVTLRSLVLANSPTTGKPYHLRCDGAFSVFEVRAPK